MRKHDQESVATGAAAGRGRGGRFSAGRKREVVMRLLRGEDLESVSRAVGITAARASHWRAQFLAAGQAGLKSRATDARDEDHRSAAGQDRRAADGDRVAVCEGGPAGGQRPFGPAEVDAMSGAQSICGLFLLRRSHRGESPAAFHPRCNTGLGAKLDFHHGRHSGTANSPTDPVESGTARAGLSSPCRLRGGTSSRC